METPVINQKLLELNGKLASSVLSDGYPDGIPNSVHNEERIILKDIETIVSVWITNLITRERRYFGVNFKGTGYSNSFSSNGGIELVANINVDKAIPEDFLKREIEVGDNSLVSHLRRSNLAWNIRVRKHALNLELSKDDVEIRRYLGDTIHEISYCIDVYNNVITPTDSMIVEYYLDEVYNKSKL